jgi:outer membrane receptor for ferrienterochelin and colicin
LHLDAQLALSPHVVLFAGIHNVFDRQYANFGLMAANAFTGPDRSYGPAVGVAPVDEQFRALGAPRTWWAGVRMALSRPRG